MTAPTLDRRAFLAGSALAGALALTGCTRSGSNKTSAAAPTQPPADLSDWNSVRAQFALDPKLAHFAAFVLAAHPAPVRAAIERWRDKLDADAATVVRDERGHDDEVRAAAARYLGVAADEIALTDSTTMGLGLTYNGLRLRPGDHVLTSTHDFLSTHEALRLAAARTGAEVERVPLYDDPATASADEIVSRVRAAVRPATRVAALTWVHSSTGVKLPIREIAGSLREVNSGRAPDDRVLLSVDAVHGLGAEGSGPSELGCDVFISGTHKWLFGPRGTGLVWTRRDAWAAIAPIIPTFTGPSTGAWLTGRPAPFVFGLDATPGGYKPFEHRWAVAEAFTFHLAIGKDRVAARTREQASRLKDGLAALDHVRLVTPRDPALSAGIVCFEVAGHEPAQVVAALRQDHGIVASVTPYREPFVRLGPSIVTTPEQVDGAVRAIASLR
jgi:selenocysteine lyase/cysteine desulfurase